jgi:hypothetical protein
MHGPKNFRKTHYPGPNNHHPSVTTCIIFAGQTAFGSLPLELDQFNIIPEFERAVDSNLLNYGSLNMGTL